MTSPRRHPPGLAVGLGAAAALIVTGAPLMRQAEPESDSPPPASAQSATLYPETIRPPFDSPRVDAGLTTPHGDAITLACGSCHATTTPRRQTRSGEDLQEFHQGLSYNHGNLTCLSCHNESNYDTLRLADGTSLPFPEVMTLCGQCHGPQLRDYRRGLHGGMNGYWDRTRGPRTRNHCVHCHDPHSPAFPLVQPVFPPRDRQVETQSKDRHHP